MDRKVKDGMTRVQEVEELVADPGFRRYHAEQEKRREFNAFDVLRYAEYEIRHSNVMAWLLEPDETHGIGRAFLEWFLDRARLPGKLPGKIVRGVGGQTVRVERELYYVDVVIFLESDQGRHIVAIENKPSRASAEHYDQVRGHEERLEMKYRGHDIHRVLLSTSREGIDGEDKIAHVSWRDVGAQIKTMHGEGDFAERQVADFIRQYLVAVARMIGPEDTSGSCWTTTMCCWSTCSVCWATKRESKRSGRWCRSVMRTTATPWCGWQRTSGRSRGGCGTRCEKC